MNDSAVRRRLIICVDGTWCTPDGNSPKASDDRSLTTVFNVFASVKVGEVVDPDGSVWKQEKHYERGLGALEKAGTLNRLHAGAWGTGSRELIRDVYARACDLGQNDEVWFYGFSRGAYIVRAVAGMLHYIRKLKAVNTNTFHRSYEEALKVYHGIKKAGSLGKGQVKINLHFQAETVQPPIVKFVGVFDTVKAVNDNNLYDISLNPSVYHLRHALALHEDRRRFAPEFIAPDETTLKETHRSGRTFVQAWFAGAHLDMGGSAEEGGLSLYPLQWMLIESRKLGLELQFHGNSPTGPQIDDPLMLVFPPIRKYGKGEEMWSCTTSNGMYMEMQDLRSVHKLRELYGLRYRVKVNRDKNPLWTRHSRPLFEEHSAKSDDASPNPALIGHCKTLPIGTTIHPSVYCLIDLDINVIMDTKQGPLVQYLSEWSANALGEIVLKTVDGTIRIPNPGFWNSDDDEDIRQDLPPLRILICGYTGVGKSTLVSKVFGVDFNTVSERTRGIHNVRDEIRIPGRDDFILHDSKGFEGGSNSELTEVEQFVRERVAEHDLRKQLHVIWFCVEVGSPRIVQTATEQLFKAMANCPRHVPIVVVATKKDAFIDMHIGRLARSGTTDLKICRDLAEQELYETAAKIEAEVTGIPGGRVDAVVCVDRYDEYSIAELTKISSEVFRDEKTRLMYIKAQMARPDLKIHMAIYEVMNRYKRAVCSAVGTAFVPFGPTGTRQGSKDDICKRIVNCFGVKGLDSIKAMKIMQSNVRDGAAEGLSMFWAEVLAAGGVTALCFVLTAPVIIPTFAAGAFIITPATAQLFLCTACDLILILARSFQAAAYDSRAQPTLSDVEVAAGAFSKYANEVHTRIRELVPRAQPFRCFYYGKIQATFEAMIEQYWQKMRIDSVREAALRNKSPRRNMSPSKAPVIYMTTPEATSPDPERSSINSSLLDTPSLSETRSKRSSLFTRWSSSTLSIKLDKDGKK